MLHYIPGKWLKINSAQWPKITWRALQALGVSACLLIALSMWGFAHLRGSLPRLEGSVTAQTLSAPVTVARDAQGVPTLTGGTRADLAWALGYLHAQERFFQMDGQRRAAAGELSDLVGRAALRRDRAVSLHRFRHRAGAVLAAMIPKERAVLDAYVAGVNRGLGDLDSVPFEYLLLRRKPQPWTAKDTVLTAFAMYLSLQEADGKTERRQGDAVAVLGTPLAAFLFPEGTSWDAPLDGSSLPTPEMPSSGLRAVSSYDQDGRAGASRLRAAMRLPLVAHWARAGLQIVANDMHLGLRVPNISVPGQAAAPGRLGSCPHGQYHRASPYLAFPRIVAGSNGRIAWGFTPTATSIPVTRSSSSPSTVTRRCIARRRVRRSSAACRRAWHTRRWRTGLERGCNRGETTCTWACGYRTSGTGPGRCSGGRLGSCPHGHHGHHLTWRSHDRGRSNGRIAWGFTNSYVDTSDAVILEPVDGNPALYRTPEGSKELGRRAGGPSSKPFVMVRQQPARREVHMATVTLLTDDELSPEARAVFDDIRAVRKTGFVNNFWRGSPTIGDAQANVGERQANNGSRSTR